MEAIFSLSEKAAQETVVYVLVAVGLRVLIFFFFFALERFHRKIKKRRKIITKNKQASALK
jgi:peroxiredoxin family protein